MTPRRRPRTLRGRVSGLAAFVIAGWLVVLAVGFDLVISSRLNTQVDDALRVRAQAVTATVIVRGGQITGVRESVTDNQLDSGIWVYDGTRGVVRPEGDEHHRHIADAMATVAQGFREVGDERFYVLPVLDHDTRIGAVVAALDREPYDHTRDIVVIGSIVLVALLALGAYPVLTRATGRALRPVAAMTAQAADWSVRAPTERFGGTPRYEELDSLARTLDELLDRLAAVLRHERQLSAELSHELRTPLARVAAEVDLLLDGAREDQEAALTSIRDGCLAMDSIMDTLLAAARSELVQTVGRCELAPLLGQFVERDPVLVQVAPTSLTVGVEADLVTRMLTPVVDNALRFAERRISLSAHRTGGTVTVAVANDGPVLDPSLAERVFEPGYREVRPGDEHDGSGLGLALARRLARSVDGDLDVDPTAAVTTFRLSLPPG